MSVDNYFKPATQHIFDLMNLEPNFKLIAEGILDGRIRPIHIQERCADKCKEHPDASGKFCKDNYGRLKCPTMTLDTRECYNAERNKSRYLK